MNDLPALALSTATRLHLVGIAGTGMQPLAVLLQAAGYQVSGSDRTDGPRMAALRALGIDAMAGHHPQAVQGAAQLVASPLIPADDPELRAARTLGIPVLARADVLARLVAPRQTICVSGSHGKTSTSALLTHILRRAGRDPGFMVGGVAPSLGAVAARLGGPQAPFVLEACEAFGALAAWQPRHIILTNIDDEHSEDYGGLAGLKAAFRSYVARLPTGGVLVGCGDDPGVVALLADRKSPALTYGFGAGNRLQILPGTAAGGVTLWRDGVVLGQLHLPLPGRHLVLNAVAAAGMALELGVDWPVIAAAISSFTGVARRMQRVGATGGITVLDDFAHHPTEVAATLQAARALLPHTERLVVVLEAQRHKRMLKLATGYAAALQAADLVLLMAVDGACRGQPNDGQVLLAAALAEQGVAVRRIAATDRLAEVPWRQGDAVIIMAHGTSDGLAKAVLRAVPDRPLGRDALSVIFGPVPQDDTPPHLLRHFARAVATAPEALAVEQGDDRLSYAHLAARSVTLAQMLVAKGVRPGDMVAVCLERSVLRVLAFLAVLQAGAVYVPLDPALPQARLQLMISDAGARFGLTDAQTRALVDATGLASFDLSGPVAAQSAALPPLNPADPAYLVYTSGSTGAPKGVVIAHAALGHYAHAAANRFEVTPAARVAPLTSFGFDISIGDMAMALTAGAAIVFPTAAQAVLGPPLSRFLARARISHITHTPTALLVLPVPPLGTGPSHVIAMGEYCPPDLVARWGAGRTVINAYGPTEVTILSTAATCQPGQPVSIGTPFCAEGVCVLDDRQHPVPVGDSGELCLFGAGLATGYHRRPFLTAERYPTVDLGAAGLHRVYRTGDIGHLRVDGRLMHEGRRDDQIKHHGFRIEPGEIEAVLRGHPAVTEAYVRLHRAPGQPDRLVAWICGAAAKSAADVGRLHSFLVQNLPAHMVPAALVPVAAIPMNANGKRSAAGLPAPLDPVPDNRPIVPPATATEITLMALYRQILAAAGPFGVRDSLSSLGADSLQTANLYMAIEEAFGVMLTIDLARDAETIELLALHLDRLPGASAPVVLAQPAGVAAPILQGQRGYLAAWTGTRFGPLGLVVAQHETGALPPLFWCFQGSAEHMQLSRLLGPDQPLFGLRSGHLVMDYTEENLQALARCYADELMATRPTGRFLLGGNCQGGLVMHRVAVELLARGRQIDLLILMEQARFAAYPGPVALMFGADSPFNPFLSMADPARLFDLAYPGGYSFDIIPGTHGAFFQGPNSVVLARTVRAMLQRPLVQSHHAAPTDAAQHTA